MEAAEAVLFDWDGTLVDSLEGFYRANETVMAALGIPFDRQRYREVYTPDWRRFYGRLGVPDERLDEANARWHAAFVPEATAMAGVVEALAALDAMGCRLGLVTATFRSVVDPQLETSGLAGFLVVRVHGDEVSAQKPDPAPLRLALERLGLADRPGAVVYVGDAPDDMRMAKAVGTGAIGIRSMLGGDAELRSAGATEVHDSVAAWVATLAGWRAAAG
jgi:phosphoglycolate phosphatase